MEKNHQLFILGKSLKTPLFQTITTGVILMASIISHGTKINIFQFTVDHAGLKVLLHHWLIDSTS